MMMKHAVIVFGVFLMLRDTTTCVSLSSSSPSLSPSSFASSYHEYAHARWVRVQHGHDAAQGLYQQLLKQNPSDRSAATHIAASDPTRHALACTFSTSSSSSSSSSTTTATSTTSIDETLQTMAQQLRSYFLDHFQYTNEMVQEKVFKVPESIRTTVACPIYISPVMAGNYKYDNHHRHHRQKNDNNDNENNYDDIITQSYPPLPTNGLECLATLFLLAITVPYDVAITCLGPNVCQLLESLGLIHIKIQQQQQQDDHDDENETHGGIVIPYVHIYPLSLSQPQPQQNQPPPQNQQDHFWFVTDLHPNCLSSTSVCGKNHKDEDPVMYIGPDSLALIQHYTMMQQQQQQQQSTNDNDENDDKNDTTVVSHVLDLCTGSGIQALTTNYQQTATCVDINPRALRFCHFNALLNEKKNVQLVLGDIVTNTYRTYHPTTKKKNGNDHDHDDTMDDAAAAAAADHDDSMTFPDESFDLVLANPPFIPVPPSHESIQNRYGLFSSGGSDGQVVLKAILKLASRVLTTSTTTTTENNNNNNHSQKKKGRLAIVSEFMNPSMEYCHTVILHHDWFPHAQGVLVTNEYPLTANMYAQRRAGATTMTPTTTTPMTTTTAADSRAENDNNDVDEYQIWIQHLMACNIETISPGLLFLQRNNNNNYENTNVKNHSPALVQHVILPKTKQGSIWTPSNRYAVEFTRKAIQKYLD